jgi:multiple sugar transport system permease protein
MGVTQEAIAFFGQRPVALIMVSVFGMWRYCPLRAPFILARMQSSQVEARSAPAAPCRSEAWSAGCRRGR